MHCFVILILVFMSKYQHVTEFNAGVVVGMVSGGKTQSYAARKLRISEATVSRIMKRYKTTGNYKRKKGSGGRKYGRNV